MQQRFGDDVVAEAFVPLTGLTKVQLVEALGSVSSCVNMKGWKIKVEKLKLLAKIKAVIMHPQMKPEDILHEHSMLLSTGTRPKYLLSYF
jgi:hypothetical protein